MKEELKTAGKLRIGDLARRTGFSVPTIRYYEQVGLLPPPVRGPTGQRVYGASALEQLLCIRRCRHLGFSVEQTRELASITEGRNGACLDALDVARRQLKAVRGKLLELMSLEASLSGLVERCSSLCAEGPAPECTMLEDLGFKRKLPTRESPCCG
jgi:DNA-binding transcriptional MerR regulator